MVVSAVLSLQHISMDVRNHRLGIRNPRLSICNFHSGIRNHRLGIRDRHVGIDHQLGLGRGRLTYEFPAEPAERTLKT